MNTEDRFEELLEQYEERFGVPLPLAMGYRSLDEWNVIMERALDDNVKWTGMEELEALPEDTLY